MPFAKGNRHGKGRRKGSKSKRVVEWEQFGRQLLDDGLPRVQRILKSSNDEMFMRHFLDLVAYFKPKPKQVHEVELETVNPIKLFLAMDPGQREDYLKKLKSKMQ